MTVLTAPIEYAFSHPYLVAVVCCLVSFLAYIAVRRPKAYDNLPFVALNEEGDHNLDVARMQWLVDYRGIILRGLKKGYKAFRVETGDGSRIVIPNDYADEIRNNAKLNFAETAVEAALGYYPGFEPIALLENKNVMQEVIRSRLTRTLDSLTPDLKAEAESCFHQTLGENPEWQDLDLKPFAYHTVARTSSSMFFGPEVGRNEEWLQISIQYTMNVFNSARVLRSYSPFVRWLVHWFIPECRKVRDARNRTQQIITPLVKQQIAEREASGMVSSSKTGLMFSWVQEVADTKHTTVRMEDIMLMLSLASVHSTTETLSFVLLDLMEHPDVINKLRDEIAEAIKKEGGWKKSALSQMQLLDSVMKESQRLRPISKIAMERRARAPVTLSSGITLPKGSHVFVDTESHWSSDIYENPYEFIADRFVKKRDTDNKGSSKWQFIMTSPEQMGFGHGLHACPGRFFVGDELKVLLAQLLLRYDWKLDANGRLPDGTSGQSTFVPLGQKVMYRRRRGDEYGIDA